MRVRLRGNVSRIAGNVSQTARENAWECHFCLSLFINSLSFTCHSHTHKHILFTSQRSSSNSPSDAFAKDDSGTSSDLIGLLGFLRLLSRELLGSFRVIKQGVIGLKQGVIRLSGLLRC
jgi:hypothetical protein